MAIPSVRIPLYIETSSDHHQEESWDDFRGKAYAMRDDSMDDSLNTSWMMDGSSSSNLGYHGRRGGGGNYSTSALDMKEPVPSACQRASRRVSLCSNSGASVSSNSSRHSRRSGDKKKPRGSLKSLLSGTGGTKSNKPVFPKNVPRTMSGSSTRSGPRMGKIDKNGRFVAAKRETTK